jgi:hypothetical protein
MAQTVFVNADMESLRTVPQTIVQILQALAARLEALGSQAVVALSATPDQKVAAASTLAAKQQIARDSAVADLDALASRAQGLYARASAAIASALGRSKPAEPLGQLLQETREMRAWQRILPQLDRALDALPVAVAIARDSLAQGDGEEYWALRSELPAYMAARAPELVPEARLRLDDALLAARPALAAAVDARAELAQGMARIEIGIGQAKSCAASGAYGEPTIPAFRRQDGMLRVSPAE